MYNIYIYIYIPIRPEELLRDIDGHTHTIFGKVSHSYADAADDDDEQGIRIMC
jgi:hypothetical protein